MELSRGSFLFESDATFIAPDVNIDWNILDRPLTPFLTAGAGAMYFIADGDNELSFSFGGGAGVRWDFADNAFLKVWYRLKRFDLDGLEDPFLIHTINIGIGLTR